MAGWRPKLSPEVDLKALTLSAVEGFVVSRIDGHTSLAELSQLTGQSGEMIEGLLERLVGEGVIESPPEEPAPAEAPPAETAATPSDHASHLAFYRAHLHDLPPDERVKLAANASLEQRSALCFDPQPQTIRALLESPHTGLEQARLIAEHHRTTTGLEFLFTRGDLLRDAQVQRLLWRNPQLAEGQLRRLVQSRRLLELWKLSISREATQQTRSATQRILRTRFQTAAAEERVELIFNTEGRALAGLAGLPVDGRTTSMLCARTYGSPMLVQNIAHWAAAPPALIAHLLKQPLVVRTPRLKQLLQHHPNAPKGPTS